LKKANIGIAMGRRGTQVAREASDMVLKDDSFSTIVVAIEQGRIIFNNIRKFIIYLLSGNASEIMIVFVASLLNSPLPILPLQILLLNIINDVFPALALGLGKGSEDVMKCSPRSAHEPVLKLSHWLAVFGYGILIAVPVLIAFMLSHTWLKMDSTMAVTVSFLTLAFARLWHIFNMRDHSSGFINNEVVKNKCVWIAIVLCTGLLLSVVYIPNISSALKLTSLGLKAWILILTISIIPLGIGQLFKKITSEYVRKN
jgi:Ca2+-transporting ATPase